MSSTECGQSKDSSTRNLRHHATPSPFSGRRHRRSPPPLHTASRRKPPGIPRSSRIPQRQFCPSLHINSSDMIHIAMTLDYSSPYLRGSIAAVLSVLQHSTCPENTVFHFLAAPSDHRRLRRPVAATFPYLHFHLYPFDPATVHHLISSSARGALDQPLNYVRIYLADLLPSTVTRVIYLDSDLIVVDD